MDGEQSKDGSTQVTDERINVYTHLAAAAVHYLFMRCYVLPLCISV